MEDEKAEWAEHLSPILKPDDGPTSWRNSISTSGCDATPTDPDIWGALAIGASG